MNKSIILSVVAIVVIAGIGLLIFKSPALVPSVTPPSVTVDIKQNVVNYLRENISTLSPVKAVLGGTWYVVSPVSIDLEKQTGTVVYEDGHIQETKNFSYTTDGKGEVVSLTITSTSSTSKKSGISGTVTLGPTCPVERIPPDPNCAPRFYSTSIAIYQAGHTDAVKIIQSDVNGAFSAELNPGNYTLKTKGGNLLPRCGNVLATVKNGQYVKVEISCDTGIR